MDDRSVAEAAARAEWIERAAHCDLMTCGGSPVLQRQLGLSVAHCGPSLVLRSRGIDSLLFNRSFGLEDSMPDAVPLADSVVARFRAQAIPRYFVHLPAATQSDPLRRHLHALGLSRYPRSWHVLVRERESLATGPLSQRVERASRRDAAAVAALMVSGFDMPEAAGSLIAAAVGAPRWHTYVVRDTAGEATAALLMHVDAEFAHITLMATVSTYRRRGAQRELLERAVSVALDLGCQQISAETGEAVSGEANPAHELLESTGFRVVRVRENWAPHGTRWHAAPSARAAL
jgi:GNAT superfamily N-acetyltransferase